MVLAAISVGMMILVNVAFLLVIIYELFNSYAVKLILKLLNPKCACLRRVCCLKSVLWRSE